MRIPNGRAVPVLDHTSTITTCSEFIRPRHGWGHRVSRLGICWYFWWLGHTHRHSHTWRHLCRPTCTRRKHAQRQLSLMLSHALRYLVSHTFSPFSLSLSPHTQYDSGRQNVFALCSDLIWKPQTWDNVNPWWPSVWPKENDPPGSGRPAPNNCEAVRQWSLAYGAVEFLHTALIYWAMYLWLIGALHAVSRQKTRRASAGWWSGMLMIWHAVVWCWMSPTIDIHTMRGSG